MPILSLGFGKSFLRKRSSPFGGYLEKLAPTFNYCRDYTSFDLDFNLSLSFFFVMISSLIVGSEISRVNGFD